MSKLVPSSRKGKFFAFLIAAVTGYIAKKVANKVRTGSDPAQRAKQQAHQRPADDSAKPDDTSQAHPKHHPGSGHGEPADNDSSTNSDGSDTAQSGSPYDRNTGGSSL
jgi:hypothetical protein